MSDDALVGVTLAIPGAGTTEQGGRDISFTLPTDRPAAGIGFSTGFFAKELEVRLDGPDGPLDPSLVHLGSDSEAAPDPLVITRGHRLTRLLRASRYWRAAASLARASTMRST